MAPKKMWAFSPGRRPEITKPKTLLHDLKKIEIQNRIQPLIERFKKQFINETPDTQYSYIIDIYTKWRGNYLYFCEKSRSEQPAMADREFEENFVRLECSGSDSFNFSYFRHTGKWFTVAFNLSLQDCLEMIEGNPNFHPVG